MTDATPVPFLRVCSCTSGTGRVTVAMIEATKFVTALFFCNGRKIGIMRVLLILFSFWRDAANARETGDGDGKGKAVF